MARSIIGNQAGLNAGRISVITLVVLGVVVLAAALRLERGDGMVAAKLPEPSTLLPPVASMRYLPQDVQEMLVSLCGGCTFADSNARWNGTDVIEEGLPRRRLASIEMHEGHWWIRYERGGLGAHYLTVVLSAGVEPQLSQGSSCMPSGGDTCDW